MHTSVGNTSLDPDVVATLNDKLIGFLAVAGPDLARADLRIPDIEIDDELREKYDLVIGDELRHYFKDAFYAVHIANYRGRNGKKFVDIRIDMKRGFAI